ncbi:MAG: cytochrome b, partial [Pseudomonadota bacterium]|nr:cytochrome b [Pseudomonadota bacterium]
FVIVGVVFLHVAALHVTGSNNPTGVEPKSDKDTVPFHPNYTAKDSYGLLIFLIIYAIMVFYAPNMLGDPDNYITANPMATPQHIVPEWYFLPFYAILRSFTIDIRIPGTHMVMISSKLGGVILMFGAVALLFLLPWLDRSPVRSGRYRPIFKLFFWVLVLDCITLDLIGARPPEGWNVVIGQMATAWYFVHFLVVLPLLTRYEKTLPLPNSISEALQKKA